MALLRITEPMKSSRPANNDLLIFIREVAKGDQAALAEVYREAGHSIYAFALSRLRDVDAADDLLQEVMLTIWRQAATFQGQSHPRTWILGIAHHKIVDVLRRRDRWSMEPVDENTIDLDPTPYDHADQEESRQAIHRALATLSDHHRQVVHLAFFEDLTYLEIAHILEIPQGTVKTRMLHAKRLLAQRLRFHRREGGR